MKIDKLQYEEVTVQEAARYIAQEFGNEVFTATGASVFFREDGVLLYDGEPNEYGLNSSKLFRKRRKVNNREWVRSWFDYDSDARCDYIEILDEIDRRIAAAIEGKGK